MELWKVLLIFSFAIHFCFPFPFSKENFDFDNPDEDKQSVQKSPESFVEDLKAENFSSLEFVSSEEADEDEVRFYIFTSSSKMKRIKTGKISSLRRAKNFVFGEPITIMIHGFLGNCKGDNFPGLLVEAYFEQERTQNLICTDWPTLAFFGKSLGITSGLKAYRKSIGNAKVVGERLAQFIQFLVNAEAIQTVKDVHIIGYSMGAHVAGAASTALQKQISEKIGRITGLDPAGPVYSSLPAKDHLDALDADFVDVYHTNSGKLGMRARIGHLDFYINGGDSQPQCKNTGVLKIDRIEPLTGMCSHQMVPKYYAQSILNKSPVRACTASDWKSNPKDSLCSELVPFGEQISDPRLHGELYVVIEAKVPKTIWMPDFEFK